MKLLTIKKIGLPQIHELQKIGTQTFQETFAEHNAEASMKVYLEEKFAIDKLTSELSNPASEFYFTYLNDEVVGYLKVNFAEAQTEINDPQSLEIERIYVLKAFQEQNVGSLLYGEAVQVAKSRDLSYIWLGVWENNLKALRFYEKNGFIVFDTHIFKLGDEEQTDLLMKLLLK